MPSRSCQGRVVLPTTAVTSLTKIFDAVRHLLTAHQEDDKAASTPEESIRRFTIALVIHRSSRCQANLAFYPLWDGK